MGSRPDRRRRLARHQARLRQVRSCGSFPPPGWRGCPHHLRVGRDAQQPRSGAAARPAGAVGTLPDGCSAPACWRCGLRQWPCWQPLLSSGRHADRGDVRRSSACPGPSVRPARRWSRSQPGARTAERL